MHTAQTINELTPHAARAPKSAHAAAEGFTILETVIALCIAMVVGLGAVSLFLFSANFNAGASDRARALAVAQQCMEILRTTEYEKLEDVSDNAGFTGTVTVGSNVVGTADQRTFNVSTTVVAEAATKQKLVTVTVTPANAGRWTGGAVVLRTRRSSHELGAN